MRFCLLFSKICSFHLLIRSFSINCLTKSQAQNPFYCTVYIKFRIRSETYFKTSNIWIKMLKLRISVQYFFMTIYRSLALDGYLSPSMYTACLTLQGSQVKSDVGVIDNIWPHEEIMYEWSLKVGQREKRNVIFCMNLT